MATNVIKSLGTTVGVSAGAPATIDSSGFGALTFTPVGDVESVSGTNGTYESVSFTPLTTGVVEKFKGAYDGGSLELTMAKDEADTGQVLLQAGYNGAAADTVHSFKITFTDSTILYVQGVITGLENAVADASGIVMVTATVDIFDHTVEA